MGGPAGKQQEAAAGRCHEFMVQGLLDRLFCDHLRRSVVTSPLSKALEEGENKHASPHGSGLQPQPSGSTSHGQAPPGFSGSSFVQFIYISLANHLFNFPKLMHNHTAYSSRRLAKQSSIFTKCLTLTRALTVICTSQTWDDFQRLMYLR